MDIVFIGAGNVATHLAPAMQRAGIGRVVQVWSRNDSSSSRLVDLLGGGDPVSNLADIRRDAGMYVVSLVDRAVSEVIGLLPHNDALWVHTSGSLSVDTLSSLSPRHGVMYPLQTFSRDVEVEMGEVPFFVEGSDPQVAGEIYDIASRISPDVHYADSCLRARMHIAAVFACNFTNYMFTVADDLLQLDGLDLSVLYPLLRETLRKAQEGSPASGQTGPAVRGDREIMDLHASSLPDDLADIYRTLSDAIYHRHHRQKTVDTKA